jgi:hypothetical protein
MRTKHLFGVSCFALALSACDVGAYVDSKRFREDFRYTYDLKPGGGLTVENFNGQVEIYGWDQNKIEINGEKYAATEDALRNIRVEAVPSADSIAVRTIPPAGERRGSFGAWYRIHVPRRTRLERIQTSNGALSVENLEGSARLRTSNGRVQLRRFNGDLEATTSNGRIDISDFTGSAVLRTSNGGIAVEGVRGVLDARTSNGGIQAGVANLDQSRPLRLETSNGGITLRLPPDINANLRARTSNASIDCDFPLTARGPQSKTHVEGAIGDGGPLIQLDTSNGGIRVLRN